MSETDDEVISVSELEFNEQIMRHRKKRRISEEEETCAFSTDSTEEESEFRTSILYLIFRAYLPILTSLL